MTTATTSANVDAAARTQRGTPGDPDGANAVLRWLRGAFSDLSYEVMDAFGSGDRVAVEPLTNAHTHEQSND